MNECCRMKLKQNHKRRIENTSSFRNKKDQDNTYIHNGAKDRKREKEIERDRNETKNKK